MVFEAGNDEEVVGSGHGVAVHYQGAPHLALMLAVVVLVYGDALAQIGYAGQGQSSIYAYLPLAYGLGVDGIEGGLELGFGERRLCAAHRHHHQLLPLKRIGFYPHSARHRGLARAVGLAKGQQIVYSVSFGTDAGSSSGSNSSNHEGS